MASADDLLKSLQQQAEVNRAAAIDASEPDKVAAYSNASNTTTGGKVFKIAGGVSIPEGTALAANIDPDSGEVVWVETFTGPDGVTSDELADRVPCANGTNCLDDNFCYGWYECEPCDWCENNTCQPRDPARPCNATWECPCAPNEDQHYDCVEGACRLTCEKNEDCEVGEVCGLEDGYCGPGCETDQQCDPYNPDRVGDAQENTFCVDRECVFACDPVRFCTADSDCFSDEYCGEREYRVASDPVGGRGSYMCLPGCRNDEACENEGETCDLEDHTCKVFCLSNADCPEDEECNADGVCSNVGKVCSTYEDCEGNGYCKDGRCTSGCEIDAHCDVVCGPDPECASACPIDPTCTCEGDGCYNENWRDLCPKDPTCLAACPDDPICTRDQGRVCVDGQCERTCSDSSDCLEDEVCDGGVCKVRTSSEGVPADDRLGCECGDVCNQYGTCEPVVCSTDEQCPPCSICEDGVCIPGCSDDNPCPENGCCNPDGRCSKSCRTDLDCLSEPGNSVCLEGGCCGFACDPLVPCISNSECEAGEYCGDENYCISGCFSDSDCSRLEEDGGGRYRCEKRYVRASNGALAPCEMFPGEECFSEVGQCVSYCVSNSDCGDGETCVDGNCEAPSEPSCSNDSQCTDGICLNGSCGVGCRFDSQCGSGERCVDNQCKLVCTGDSQCVALQGAGSECIDGTCQSVNSGSGGRKGCECYEFCDSQGYCQPYQCNSDLDCDEKACGSCLATMVCGECESDIDCPGTKVCDKSEGAATGTCAFSCTPGGPGVCLSSSDCPDGFFCSGGTCERGCVENEDCGPGDVCRGDQCVKGCTTDAACGGDFVCVQGGCLYAGKPCSKDNNLAKAKEDRLTYLQNRLEVLRSGSGNESEILQVEGEIDVAQLEYEEAQNSDCGPGESCEGDQCQPIPAECLADFECQYPALCVNGYCQEPPGADSYEAFDPQVIGCPSCADTCDRGICRPTRCTSDEQCGCGFCSRGGECIETCSTDLDCGSTENAGRCVSGECVQCTSNFDCRSFGEGSVCDGGECKTPCGEGISTGDCFNGLNDGDTCGACPGQCPDGAPCRKTQEVCGTQEVYDIREGRTRVTITYCQKCSRSCISSADCETGTVCGAFGICESSDGRCTNDSDCYQDALAAGLDNMRCVNNTCIQPGETCFTNSDCETGEICDGGECLKGECGDNDPCQLGKVCVDNQCVWECGSGAQVITCRSPQDCPPGYSCGCDKGYGGYCIRPGITCDTLDEPTCPSGTVCCGGGCVSLSQAGKQCCEDDQCLGGKKCCDGLCRSSCGPEGRDPETNPADESLTQQDNCQAIGKCCGADGWCEPCGCGPDNPCSSGQCCDEASGTCISFGDHPNTRFGRPLACKFDQTYCKLLTWDNQEVVPDELGDADYKGCEVLDPVRNILRCWEGADKSEEQIERLVHNACFKPTVKECRCDDEIPDQDECITDIDCGSCGICEEKTFTNDACCGIYGEGEYETGIGDNGIVGTDYIRRRVCVSDNDTGECGCRTNDDCTECETCVGGGVNTVGQCVADCLGRCPCGGDLSRGGKCPTCEERYGPCAKNGTVELIEKVDPETGEIVQIADSASCQCGVDLTKNCCAGLTSLEDMQTNRTRCLRQNVTLLDGSTLSLQTETCYDEESDECAQCDVDADCPGPSVCEGHKCISECGLESSRPSSTDATTDRQDVGSIGGDPYSCYCCSEAGQCRPLFDNWIESNAKQLGPWTFTYERGIGLTGKYTSQQESYEAALAEFRSALGDAVRILNSEGESNSGECRPCECKADGIECAPWASCDGCYTWENTTPDDNNLSKAEKLRLEDEMFKAADAVDKLQSELDIANENLAEKFNEYLSARQTFANQVADRESELNLLYEQRDEQNERLNLLNQELLQANYDVVNTTDNLQRIAVDGTELEIEGAQAQLEGAENEQQEIQDAYNALQDEVNQTTAQIDEIVNTSATNAELQAQVDQAYLSFKEADQQRLSLLNQQQSLNDAQLKAVEAYNTAYYKPATYRQVRTTECCIDDTARPDGECVYGTCFICGENYDGGAYEGEYEAALYGKATGNRVSLDTDYEGYCKPKIEGKTAYKYIYPGGANCVMGPCGFWYMEQRLGTGYNQRYWEYCQGIIGCVLRYKSDKEGCKNPEKADYLQGWKYDMRLDEAGIFFTNDFVNWAKLGQFEGTDGSRKSSCLYSNSAAFLGANTIGIFEDLVASHPICAKADLIHGCPDDQPGCAAVLRQYYQRGSVNFEIDRLKREIKQLEAYIAMLTDVQAQLTSLEQTKKKEKEEIQAEIEQGIEQLDSYKGQLEQLRSQQETLELELGDLRTKRDDAQKRYDEQLDVFVTADEAVIDARQELSNRQQDFDNLSIEYGQVVKNINSARASLNETYLAINQANEELNQLQADLAGLVPGSAAYAQKEVEILNKQEEIDQLREDYSTLVSEEQALQSVAETYNNESLPEAQSLIDEQQQILEDLEFVREQESVQLAVRREGLEAAIAEMSGSSQNLLSVNNEIPYVEEQIEFWSAKVGDLKYDEDYCADGYSLAQTPEGSKRCCLVTDTGTNCAEWKFPGGDVRECSDLCQQIENIDEVLLNIVASKTEVETAKESQQKDIDKKQDRITELSAEEGDPTIWTGPMPLPIDDPDKVIRTAEELKEEYEGNVDVDSYLADQESWIAGATSEA